MGERIYGLLGKGLRHSYSVPIHKRLGDYDYRLIELGESALGDFMRRPDLAGLNVTIPYKRDIMKYCDVISEEALKIGSVNTVVRSKDGRLFAYNTDKYGLEYMVRRAGIDFTGKKVLILGSGGTSLTARAASETLGAREIVVVGRQLPDNYTNLHKHFDAEIIVNTTPVGMYPDTGGRLVSLSCFPALSGVVDVIYNPQRTELILEAKTLKIPYTGGLVMLVAQAKAAAELFMNKSIDDSKIEEIYSGFTRETENIVIAGMPGSGKTSIGKALSAISGRELLDLDSIIEDIAEKTISEIFSDDGEEAFRKMERTTVRRAGSEHGRVIATGGGVVLFEGNYRTLKQNGRIYHITRDVSKLPTEGRPLSKNLDTLKQMWEERLPLYQRFADREIENENTVEDAALEIWRDFCEYSCY